MIRLGFAREPTAALLRVGHSGLRDVSAAENSLLLHVARCQTRVVARSAARAGEGQRGAEEAVRRTR